MSKGDKARNNSSANWFANFEEINWNVDSKDLEKLEVTELDDHYAKLAEHYESTTEGYSSIEGMIRQSNDLPIDKK